MQDRIHLFQTAAEKMNHQARPKHRVSTQRGEGKATTGGDILFELGFSICVSAGFCFIKLFVCWAF